MFGRSGTSELTPDGFSGPFADFAASHIYNSMFADATVGLLPLGTSRDDPAGHTVNLDFWTAWRSTGSATATVVADVTWPGGNYVEFRFAATGDATHNNIALTTDLFPVAPGFQVEPDLIQAWNVPLGTGLAEEGTLLFYDASGSFISGSLISNGIAGASTGSMQFVRFAGATLIVAPANARSARFELMYYEITGTAHNAATYLRLGTVAVSAHSGGNIWPLSVFAGDSVQDGGGAGGATGGVYVNDTTGNSAHGLTFGGATDSHLWRSAYRVLTSDSAIIPAGNMGAAFPTGGALTAYGDNVPFFRTDLGESFYHTPGRWLGHERTIIIPCDAYASVPWVGTEDIAITGFGYSGYGNAPQNSGNHGLITLNVSAGSDTFLGVLTVPYGTGGWYRAPSTIGLQHLAYNYGITLHPVSSNFGSPGAWNNTGVVITFRMAVAT
jgi:hypothetical protein